jgi:hypothetical protein
MSDKFENDLRESFKWAAYYLIKNHKIYNDDSELKENKRSYSGEREFVAEVYRLIIEKDASYRDKLFIEDIRHVKGEDQEKVTPDLVYRDEMREKCVIEVKAPVDNRADGSPIPVKRDKEAFERDYEKLKNNYDQFESKFMVIASLGDPILENGKEFQLEGFKKWVENEFLDMGKIKVIVC